MQTLPISDITVAKGRQRTALDDESLEALSESIREIGLLHPIVIRREGAQAYLVAGERRLRAIENLTLLGQGVRCAGESCPEGHAPITDLGSLDPINAWQAELEENIRRVDLPWQDRAAAEARLIVLRQQIAKSAGGPVPSMLEIAKEISPGASEDYARDSTRQSVLLTERMHIPEIAKAATKAEAWKIFQRKEQEKRDEALGQAVGRQSSSTLYQVWNEDCRAWLARSTEKFDCILIDPPYGMGADEFGDGAGKRTGITHQYSDDAGSAMSLMRQVARPLSDAGKEQCHIYVWCDIDRFLELRDIYQRAGWWVHRTPLINVKREGGRVPWPEHGPRRCYELVLYAVKGKKPVTAIYKDVFESTLERDTDGHGAAKPVEAYVELLKRSCRPGDSVLDCFAGTGTILTAAAQLKLKATAVEQDPTYYGQILRRLEGLK
jgi:DNA modification methylase